MSRQKLLYFRSKEQDDSADDAQLVRDCLQGDRRSFEKLVERHRNQVFWTCYNLILDYEDARDLTQQTFLKVWVSLGGYKPEKPFSAWIRKIAANNAVDFLRSRKTTEEMVDVAAEDVSLERNLDLRKIFSRVVPMLSERQRVVLVLREVDDMDIPEIAEMLDCTESTVRNLLSQAKESFRKKVREIFPDYGS